VARGSLHKTRLGDRNIEIDVGAPIEAVGRPVLIVDDIASSGATLAKTVRRVRGTASVDIAVVHVLMTRAANERLHRCGARLIVSTDSARHPTNAADLAPFLAPAVLRLRSSL
jgi:ribose-phosphate pyrophosphokinase